MSQPTPMAQLVEAEQQRVAGLTPAQRTTERRDADDALPLQAIPVPLVPKRFAAVRFENYKPETDSEAHALRVVQRWTDLVAKREGPMLALIGPQGTGKSHLLYAAAWALHKAHARTCCRSWYRLADELRYGGPAYYGTQHMEAHEHRTLLWRQPAILLDEVRATANTAFDDTELAKLACHCYDQELPILLTTNINPLADVLGPAAASRFTQVMLTGRDRRQEQIRATP